MNSISMKRIAGLSVVMGTIFLSPFASATTDKVPVPVTIDNFKRVESDLYFAKFVKQGAFGKFLHAREVIPIQEQEVIRMNRDTLYSYGVADLSAGPVTLNVPDAGKRFLAIQVIDEDHYSPFVIYKPGKHKISSSDIDTRYVLFLARTFVDPNNPDDIKAVHALQDKLAFSQGANARFDIPMWDTDKAQKIRTALNALAAANGGLDSARMFGAKDKVDPVQHLLGTAAGWGGNPVEDAYYSGANPEKNDGKTIYQLKVNKVPVDGFWSISVYNKEGFFEKNALDAYSINNVTAKQDSDGSVTVRFGGCDGYKGNCLPITEGWNYIVRLYRPRAEILDGSWTFPEAQPIK